VKAVLIAIAMWDDGRPRVFPTNKWVAAHTGVKISSVTNAIRALTQAGFLTKTSRGFKKAKNWWLNWEVIEAGYEFVDDETGEVQPIQAEATGRVEQPGHQQLPCREQPRHNEQDPVTDELVDLIMERVAGLGPIGESLTREAVGPVIRPMRKRHKDIAIKDVVTGLKNFQWKLIVQAESPAAYLTKTLTNTLSGITHTQAWEQYGKEAEAAREEEAEPVEQPGSQQADAKPVETEPREQPGRNLLCGATSQQVKTSPERTTEEEEEAEWNRAEDEREREREELEEIEWRRLKEEDEEREREERKEIEWLRRQAEHEELEHEGREDR
jgi:hypothetical protein